MLKQGNTLLLAALVGLSLVGCSAGTAPAGASPDEVKAAYENMPLEDKLKIINGASMPADKKKEKIEEAYRKAGKTPPGDNASAPAANAPAGGPPPGMGMPSQGGR